MLLAWIKAKGAVVVTCVFINRLRGDVIDVEIRQHQLLLQMTDQVEGLIHYDRTIVRHGLRKLGVGVLFGILILVACSYFKGRNKRRNVAEVTSMSSSHTLKAGPLRLTSRLYDVDTVWHCMMDPTTAIRNSVNNVSNTRTYTRPTTRVPRYQTS